MSIWPDARVWKCEGVFEGLSSDSRAREGHCGVWWSWKEMIDQRGISEFCRWEQREERSAEKEGFEGSGFNFWDGNLGRAL